MNIAQEVKAWGVVRHIFATPQCAVSVLRVEKGAYCSKHYHEHRVNRFVVESGCIEVIEYHEEEKRIRLEVGDVHDVAAGVTHRFEVIESGIVVEVYWPAYGVRFDDIKRIEYGGRK